MNVVAGGHRLELGQGKMNMEVKMKVLDGGLAAEMQRDKYCMCCANK